MSTSIRESAMVSPFFVFFLVHANIVGVGILGFQRTIVAHAGYDAWISQLLAGASIHLIIWMLYSMLNVGSQDLFSLHEFCFGKWLGKLMSFVVLIYIWMAAFLILRSYVSIVKQFIFPLMHTWSTTLIILLLILYIVAGGFRTVTGVCFFGVVIPAILMLPLFLFPFEYAHPNNLFPMFSHNLPSLFASAKDAVINYMGFELLLFYYPFIKRAAHSQKWAHAGVLFSTLLYVAVALVTFLMFSQGELDKIIWPTLTMLKIVEIPILQRLEFIVISLWLFVILPNICLNLWGVTRGLKQIFGISQIRALLLLLASLAMGSFLLEGTTPLLMALDFYGKVSIVFIYGYIPLLFLLFLLWGKKRSTARYQTPGAETEKAR
ncbi:GerAB/ArcD/ProY family transporter [Brevibacillus sp. HB1.2]|uniref:GerAB/ArcD/ProY family transporter n=1 Tax=Brevibacillus sp. HB1.2 TaxID=2738807 RepID=UPI00157606BF|nr:GerAB/ArcD/ProY family transporter [Brevibacillus sp. HB1.2]